jgi:uncharacterized LabA/DUF88 family protein
VHFDVNERVAILIDGVNLYHTTRALGIDVDFKRLLDVFRQRVRLLRALYYTALAEDEQYSVVRPLIDWLNYNGFTVVTKPTKEYVDTFGRRKVKGNMDIEIAVDAMLLAPHVDHLVLFSSDGDFRSMVAAVQERGKRVSVVSTLQSQQGMVADELRRQADQFIELTELAPLVSRSVPVPERPSVRRRRVTDA